MLSKQPFTLSPHHTTEDQAFIAGMRGAMSAPLNVSCWLGGETSEERSGEEVPVKGVFSENWTQEYFQILILKTCHSPSRNECIAPPLEIKQNSVTVSVNRMRQT